jgi:hypothetical protein
LAGGSIGVFSIMPNYCFNTLTLIGHQEDLAQIKEHELSFKHFVPAEEDVDKQREAWGTKWEAWDVEVKHEDENLLVLKYITAWCPAFTFLKKLNELFPKLWIKNEWNVCELGAAGVWMHYKKEGKDVCKSYEWEEPAPYLSEDGEIVLPE